MTEVRQKKIPIGVDDFGKLIKQDFYYTDKSLLIKELIDNYSEVNLFTRPRRFGKSLNISMLQYYFDNLFSNDVHVFNGLKITEAGENYQNYQNQFPVIKMTLKGAAGLTFESAFAKFKTIIAGEFERHSCLLESEKLTTSQNQRYTNIIEKTASLEDFEGSLRFLSDCLQLHYNKQVIILIDEYDVPIEKAHAKGFYEEMVSFIRSFFGEALKTNPSLFFAVVTGCLRISKEDIFTGLNNLDVIPITSNKYSEHFGFTDLEASNMLNYYGLENKLPEMRDWYNGYLFGETTVYNPWSAIKYLSDAKSGKRYPQAHWANTSSNYIIRQLIDIADAITKVEIEHLIAGGTIIKPIKEDIVYAEVTNSMDNLWNFLFFTGYLKKVEEEQRAEKIFYELKIPNREVRYIYIRHISEWLEEKTKITDLSMLYQAIITEDTETFSDQMTMFLMEVISFMDNAENFYHGFLGGVLRSMNGYLVKSNRESGNGRSDYFIKPTSLKKQAFIIEVKIADTVAELEATCDKALKQIEDKNYVAELALDGYTNVTKYGLAFFKKTCMIKMGD